MTATISTAQGDSVGNFQNTGFKVNSYKSQICMLVSAGLYIYLIIKDYIYMVPVYN